MIMLTDSLNDALTVNAKVDQGSAISVLNGCPMIQTFQSPPRMYGFLNVLADF